MRITTLPSRADACARAFAIALGFSIPVSVALDNILLALLLVSWLASGDFREKFAAIKSNPVALAALQAAGDGLPRVEVAGLTIAPSGRKLYAGTHGLSAWQLTLP